MYFLNLNINNISENQGFRKFDYKFNYSSQKMIYEKGA
jgi:hypothetical protein